MAGKQTILLLLVTPGDLLVKREILECRAKLIPPSVNVRLTVACPSHCCATYAHIFLFSRVRSALAAAQSQSYFLISPQKPGLILIRLLRLTDCCTPLQMHTRGSNLARPQLGCLKVPSSPSHRFALFWMLALWPQQVKLWVWVVYV